MSLRRLAIPVIRVASIVLLIVVSISVLSGCGGSSTHASVKPTPTLPIPKDPAPVTVVKGKATTLDLGGGADLIIPPGAMTPGATVRATFQGRPAGNWPDIAPTFAPVELITNPPDAIHGLLTLEFPVDPNNIVPGVDPAVQFGISTYNDASKTWTPVNSTYDPERHMVVALIQHFSWWNPFTWDFGALFNALVQGFGQLVGTREGPASCSGAPPDRPDWVASLTGITNASGVAIRSCTQTKGDILDVEFVNNRPYSQILTYGSSVQWGWHQSEASLSDSLRDQSMDGVMSPYELFLPALGRASVGIYKPGSSQSLGFRIAPTPLTFSTDLLYYMLGQAIDLVPLAGVKCATAIVNGKSPLRDFSLSTLRDDLVLLAGCVEQSFWDLVKIGALDSWKAEKLATLLGKLKGASLVANGIELAGGVVWKIGDFLADWPQNHSTLGNGFSVTAKSATPPTPTPVPPHPQPTPTPAPTSHPVNAYDNYGQSNLAGHAMCRGNPNNYLSMPGGVGTQTFTVPNGVSTLNSAIVQIDPAPVTAHLSIAVNGNVVASTAANAVGDTHFNFGPVSVHPGDVITLSIAFTATDGKIITLYTVGNPGGRFTASNSCPDGAPNYTTTTSGLRAVVSGMS